MKKIGIMLLTLLLISSLTSCQSSKKDVVACYNDTACQAMSLNMDSDSNNAFLQYINITVKEQLSMDIIESETLFSYDEYTPGDVRVDIIIYEVNGLDQTYTIEDLDNLFSRYTGFIVAQGIQYNYFKLQLKVKGSFEQQSITIDDGEKYYRQLSTGFNEYDSLTETEKTKLREDVRNLKLFDRASYDFMYHTISILFNYKAENEEELVLFVTNKDPEDDSFIDYDKIHTVYIEIFKDIYTVTLEKEE